MMDNIDIGTVTVKDLLEKKVGKEAADRVVKAVNEGYQKGLRGEDLQKHYQGVMQKEGHDVPSDPGDILYGFIFI